ncbi:hypothetical protein L2E82_29857 [Cichorium intybus]|uniref:Uncharacterized protein n=1 Tax=Cichorium intybus TaxID=13427 RepID=A0ACB9CZ36_CICIN|nr:hypothetical protein L2E82_29857 [Cichorium intybus]
MIIKGIKQALDIEFQETTSIIRSHQPPNLESFRIPLRMIKSATRDFSPETRIAVAGHENCLSMHQFELIRSPINEKDHQENGGSTRFSTPGINFNHYHTKPPPSKVRKLSNSTQGYQLSNPRLQS